MINDGDDDGDDDDDDDDVDEQPISGHADRIILSLKIYTNIHVHMNMQM